MGRHQDERGVIQDILDGPIDAVTHIFTRAGAVRGNHIHQHTVQWTYVIRGKMMMAGEHVPDGLADCGPGALVMEPPGVPHAWKALEDTEVLVFTRGPRSGEQYESDTVRLPYDQWLIGAPERCVACHKPGTDDRPLAVISGGGKCHAVCEG